MKEDILEMFYLNAVLAGLLLRFTLPFILFISSLGLRNKKAFILSLCMFMYSNMYFLSLVFTYSLPDYILPYPLSSTVSQISNLISILYFTTIIFPIAIFYSIKYIKKIDIKKEICIFYFIEISYYLLSIIFYFFTDSVLYSNIIFVFVMGKYIIYTIIYIIMLIKVAIK